ncbi:MAG: hypothetical protein ABIB47_05795 [Candidatus Woesearchaeota archaeon]
MVFTIKDILNALGFVFTIFLSLYGLTKGYDVVELVVYVLYFTAIIILIFINLFERK